MGIIFGSFGIGFAEYKYKAKSLYHDYNKTDNFLRHEEEINKNLSEAILNEGFVSNDAVVPTPLFQSYATINDAHFLSEEEIQNLIDGNIDGELIHKLYKRSNSE